MFFHSLAERPPRRRFSFIFHLLKKNMPSSKIWTRNFCTAFFDETDIETLLADHKSFKYLIVGYEICPKTKKKHAQTYGEKWSTTRWSTLFKKYPKTTFRDKKGHLLSRKGKPSEASNYCKKDGNFVEFGKLPDDPQQGKKVLPTPYCPDITLTTWQDHLCQLLEKKPSRTIYWYWSVHGSTGKTTFAKYLCAHYSAIITGGKAADIRNCVSSWVTQNNRWVDVPVVINIPKSYNSDFLSYEGFENIKDMCFYSGKYEGGMVVGPPCHLIIFANHPPDETRMTQNRFVVTELENILKPIEEKEEVEEMSLPSTSDSDSADVKTEKCV